MSTREGPAPGKAAGTDDGSSSSGANMRGRVRVALDWTPNANHAGLFLAQAKGWFEAAGLDVEFLPGTAEEVLAHGSPARALAAGAVDLAIGPCESAISFAANTETEKATIVAIAALMQDAQTSAIAVSGAAQVDRPAQLEGKTYGSYCGRFEDGIVRAMVEADGGDPSLVRFVPLADHGYRDDGVREHGSLVRGAMASGTIDATWIFTHWEAVLARRDQFSLTTFPVPDFGVPYGYPLVLLARQCEEGSGQAETLRLFLAAASRGYAAAASNPAPAAAALAKFAGTHDEGFLVESVTELAPHLLDSDGRWGSMTESRWEAFITFLFEKNLVRNRDGTPIARESVQSKSCFTTAFLPADKAQQAQ